MNSPYFQKINFQQPDFSPIVRGGEAYANAFYEIGNALGKVGNAYFEKKGIEKSAKDFLMSPAGPEFLKTQAGWDDEMIAEMQQDPRKAEKYVYDAMREGGGPQKFKEGLMQARAEQRMEKQFQQSVKNNNLTNQSLQISLNENKRLVEESKNKSNLYSHMFKKDDQGNVSLDKNNLLKNTPEGQEYLAYQIIGDMGLNNLNMPGWLSAVTEDGSDLLSYPDQLMKQASRAISMHPGTSIEEQEKALDIVRDRIIEPANITKTAVEFWDTDPNNKPRLESMEAIGDLKVNISTAIGQDDDNKYYIKNAPSAGTAVRKFARVANGAGVMTDQDVSSVGGPQNFNSMWNRFTNKYLSDTVRPATEQDVDLGYANSVGEEIYINTGASVTPEDLIFMKDATIAIEKLNRGRLQDAGIKTQEHLQSTYATLSSDRLLQLNPYAEYFNDAMRIDVTDDQYRAMKRMMQDEGVDSLQQSLKKTMPNMTDGQFQNMLNIMNGMELDPGASIQTEPKTEGVSPSESVPVEPELPTGTKKTSLKDKVKEADADTKGGFIVAGGVAGGLATNAGLKLIYAGGDTVKTGVDGVKKIASNRRLTESAERLLPQKIKAELRRNPRGLGKYATGPHGPLGAVAKKMGIEKIDEMAGETVEKVVKQKIKNDLREKLVAKGGPTALAKIAKVFRPDKLWKKAIPFAGWATATADYVDIMDVALDEVSGPEKVKKLEASMKTIEQEMLKSGANPLEILMTAEAFEELIKEAQANIRPTLIQNQGYMDSSSTGELKQNLGDYFR
jgi:hypothetical protein